MSAKAKRQVRGKAHQQRALNKQLRRRARRAAIRPGAAGAAAALALGMTGVGTATAAVQPDPVEPIRHDAKPRADVVAQGKKGARGDRRADQRAAGVTVDGDLFFATYGDGDDGRELWKTDGTTAGTVLVKDINPGYGSSDPQHLTVVDGTLFFTADDGTTGRELWKSDGTPGGTVLVKNIDPGASYYYDYGPDDLTAVGSTLFFSVDDGTHGRELWKSDGTPDRTVLVEDIDPRNSGVLYTDYALGPRDLTAVGPTLFFTTVDSTHGRELWKSDGTSGGTVLVENINTDDDDGYGYGSSATDLTAVGSTLFFTADDGTTGQALWKSDGTEAGTVLVKDVDTSSGDYYGYYGYYGYGSLSSLTAAGGTLFFVGDDGVAGGELWTSDGTEAGTVPVEDILAGSDGSEPGNLTAVGSTVFFSADDGTHGRELWASDGSAAGTDLVEDVSPGPSGSSPSRLTAVGDALFFTALDGAHGRELWTSDGSAAGTALTKDLTPGTTGTDLDWLSALGDTAFFEVQGDSVGHGLWKSDGNPAGTVLVREFSSGSVDDGPALRDLTGSTTRLFFSDTRATTGRELWASDGSVAGTAVVKDIWPGTTGSHPSDPTPMGSTVFFTADDGTSGRELWTSDGSAAGTVLVKDVRPGAASSYPDDLVVVGSTLFFTADDGVNGPELWKSDGTEAGTALVKVLDPDSVGGYYSSGFRELTAVGDTLFFTFDDGSHGPELWKSDGSAAGTVMVEDITPGAYGSYYYGGPRDLAAVGGVLYFTADDGTHGREVWKSDGSAAGTVLVSDIHPGEYGSGPSQLTAVGSTLFLTANWAGGRELWKSDGSAAGTVLVKDIHPGGYGGYPSSLTAVGGTLFFLADDGTTGYELWKSDGTAAGTSLVKDISPGGGYRYFYDLTAVGGTLYFNTSGPVGGYELWRSDGTSGGTFLVKDIVPGGYGSYPDQLTAVGSTLFFTAWTAGDRELWKSDGTSGGTVLVQNPAPDTTPPETAIDSGPAHGSTITTGSATFAFSGTPSDTAKLQCSLDGAPFADCTSPRTFTGLADGNHTVAFRAVDPAGNHDLTPATRTFTVNTTAVSPPSNAFTLPASGTANTKKATLTLKVTLPGAGVLSLGPAGKAPVRTAKVTAKGGGAVKLKIKLTKAGLKKIKAKPNGKLNVKVKITFTPAGGAPHTLTKKYPIIYK